MTLYADLLRYPDLFGNLFRRELYARYKGSLLGVGWTLVNPLVLVGVYTLVFSVLWRSAGIEHYPLFIVSGLTVWIFFSGSILAASTSIVGHANLVKQVRFPRQLLPLAVVGSNLVTYVVMLVVIGAINFALVPRVRTTIWAVIPLSITLVALVSGLSIVLAALSALYRDVEHLLLTALLPWFFLTPVFYDLRTLPGVADHHLLMEILHWGNPATPFVESIRGPLFYGQYPGLGDVLYVVIGSAVALTIGAAVFRRLDDQLAVEL
jgi:homopolymeric O-antigen transport system permease protein